MRSKAVMIIFLSLVLLLSGCGQTAAESTPEASSEASESTYISLGDLDISECVQSVTYKGLYSEKEDTALTDAEFEYALYTLRSQYATTEEIIDRSVEEDDTINLDYIAMIGETIITDFWQDGAELTVGGGTTFAEFEDALVGRPCGEDFTVDVILPESISEEYGGQEAEVIVTINYIESDPILPELTDEFVASLDDWDCSTVDEFKEVYRSYLEGTKAGYYESQYSDELWKQVEASAVITDAGEEFIDSYTLRQLDDCRSSAEASEMALDAFADYYGYEGEEALLEAVEEGAAEEAKSLLLVTYIADVEGIAYTDDEYYGAVDSYAEYMGFESTADMISEYGLDYIQETVGNGLLSDMVRDFVVKNAE